MEQKVEELTDVEEMLRRVRYLVGWGYEVVVKFVNKDNKYKYILIATKESN